VRDARAKVFGKSPQSIEILVFGKLSAGASARVRGAVAGSQMGVRDLEAPPPMTPLVDEDVLHQGSPYG
jgi:hypothetical protein